jgi:hypothetical protein
MSFACGPSILRECKLQGKNSKNIWFFNTWFFNSSEGSTNPNKFSVCNFNIATYRHMHGLAHDSMCSLFDFGWNLTPWKQVLKRQQ